MSEPDIVIEHRAELIYLLTEAAEIEHGLLCCYLYAAYSLKDGEGEGLSPSEAAGVGRIRRILLDVAQDEMAHLALVANLLTAVGNAPHWQRPNFPVTPGYHPAGVVVSLAPFDDDTLNHFLYLERPEGVDRPDGAGFAVERAYDRPLQRGRLVPSAQDYQTVGHLYRGIRGGLVGLSEQLGEKKLFCGDERAQVGSDVLPMRGLTVVKDLASGLAAVDTIVTQGEGAPGHDDSSHYQRFLTAKAEHDAMRRANPQFVAAHAAARNPVMRKPPESAARVWITREPAASLLDLGNALYALMLRGLDALFSHPVDDPDLRDLLVDVTLVPMRALGPIASMLPRLPATDDDAGPRAGLTFTASRSQHSLADVNRALGVIGEHAQAIVGAYDRIGVPEDGRLRAGRDAIAKLAARLIEQAERCAQRFEAAGRLPPVRPQQDATAAPDPLPAAPFSAAHDSNGTASVEDGFEVVRGKHIVLNFEAKRCIHARHCVLETPDVFLANVKGPWIHPDAAPEDRLVHVARSCPSGAITYERIDGGAQEDAPPVNLLRVRERGPLAVNAELHIDDQRPCYRATLCRCGASKNKPYCDGSHNAIAFDATGEPATVPSEPLAKRGGPLFVTPLKNGPLRVRGSLELLSGTGRTIRRVEEARLCRCGGSANKPYCDGTHARIGFGADGLE